MEKSESIKNIAKAIAEFQHNMGKIAKTNTNPFFNSRYADLAAILDAIKEPLFEAGLSFTQFPTGQNGLTTLLMHPESGEYMQTEYYMNPAKSDPQAQGSAITYMRRYALAAVLGLNIDGDDDGNAATHGTSQPEQKPAKQATKQAQGDDNKPWLNEDSKEFRAIQKRIENGEVVPIETIRQHFKVSKNTQKALEDILPNGRQSA